MGDTIGMRMYILQISSVFDGPVCDPLEVNTFLWHNMNRDREERNIDCEFNLVQYII